MLTHEEFRQILNEVAQQEILQSPRCMMSSSLLPEPYQGLEGEVTVQGCSVTLQILLDQNFPSTLPHFLVREPEQLGLIPHLDTRGVICYADPEGLVYDRHRPVQVIIEAFKLAVKVLDKGITGQNLGDFADEFEVYWQSLPGLDKILSVFYPGDVASETYIASDKKTHEVRLIGGEKEIASFCAEVNFTKSLAFQPALFVPLEKGTLLIPPALGKPFWTLTQMRELLLPAISPQNREVLNLLLKSSKRANEYTIFKLPRPSGGDTLFGVRFVGTDNKHPLLQNGTARQIFPVLPIRLNYDYLVHRGGGKIELKDKRVLVIGCGAVGGYLVYQLAQAGLLRFTLVDPDRLLPENTFRHLLGRGHWMQSKVTSLKKELESKFPYVKITPVTSTIQVALNKRTIRLENYDLVVVALGKPSVEFEINQLLQSLEKGPPAIFTWLEPLGIGGHALLTNHPKGEGCFECLYTPTQEEESEVIKPNRAAFAAPDQSFGRALSGCGSLFTPYGAMDAQQTALLAARLAIDTLSDKVSGNPLLSWKGDDSAFVSQGFRLSYRFNFKEEDLKHQGYSYLNNNCRVCHPIEKEEV